MKHECKFNPETDIEETMSGLSIDLSRAITEGVIKDTGDIPYHNEIADPSTITGRVTDVFQAIDADKALKSNMKAAAAKAKALKQSQTQGQSTSSATSTATTQE